MPPPETDDGQASRTSNQAPLQTDDPAPLEHLWREAYNRCLQKLPAKEVSAILRINTYHQLAESISYNNQKLMSSTLPRALAKIEPFISSLRAFFTVVDSMVQANPEIAALVWGSIKFLLELTSRIYNATEQIADGLVEISKQMPRFGAYQKMFKRADRLTRALVDLYEGIAQFCVDCVLVFNRSTFKILANAVLKNYAKRFETARDQIAKAARFVDVEAAASNMELDEVRFEQVMSVLNRSKGSDMQPSTANSIKLPCRQIPYDRNSSFFARSLELKLCCDTLLGPAHTGSYPRWLSLHGDGGVGKTSIALEFVHQQKDAYAIIAWFQADKVLKLERGFREFATKLGLHENSADAKADQERVLAFLTETSHQWIMIFDNVEHDIVIRDYVPKSGCGSILLTSRNPESQYGLGVAGCRVVSFDKEDSTQFLFKSLPYSDPEDPLERQAAQSLIRDLGGLPLGIRQIGGFIRESGSSIQECVALLSNKAEEGDILSDESGFSAVPYSSALSKTWQASVSQLDRSTLSILSTLSFLDPDCIQSQFTKELQQATLKFRHLFPDIITSIDWLQSMRHLLRRGLIEQMQSGKTARIHRLVQTTMLHSMNTEERQTFFDVALEVVGKGHPQSQDTGDTLFGRWDVCAEYAPHVQRLQELQKAWQLEASSPSSHFNLFFNSSWYLLETGYMERALRMAQCAEGQIRGDGAESELNRAILYNTYGVVALQHTDYDAAESWFRQTKVLRERHLHSAHVLVVSATLNLVLLLLNQMRAREVIEVLEQNHAAIYGDETLPVRYRSGVDDFLAEAHLFLGNYDTAWECLQRSITMTRETVPLESQGSGYYYFIQGNIRSAQGRLADALQYHTLGLEVRKKVLGDHIQTAGSCYRVGDIAAKIGDSQVAIEKLLEAKRIYGNLALVGNYSDGGVARALWRLSQVYVELGNQNEASQAKDQALRLFQEVGRPLHEEPSTKDFDALVPPLDR